MIPSVSSAIPHRVRVGRLRATPLAALLLLGVPIDRESPALLPDAMTRAERDSQGGIEGRWDLVVRTPEGDRPSWIEVRRSGRNALVGEYVGIVGSARPVSHFRFENGTLRFAVPPQWEEVTGDITFEGRLEGDGLVGTMTAGGTTLPWTARRAPTLRRAASPVWNPPLRLFNGRDLAGWRVVGGDNRWRAENGLLRNTASGGNLVTERTFEDFRLHVEFRYPKDGNSGVYLRGRYEVQVEDTPGPEPTLVGFGAVYGFLKPSLLASHKPGEWQSYDITLVGRHVTIVANGKTIISNAEIPGITGGALDSDEGAPGPIMLQGDHTAVEYRNITIMPARR